VHVCIINVAISRLGWTLMKDITSQHELSFTTQWENTIMYLEPHADIELSRKWPIICRYVLPDRLRFHIGIHSSRSMPSFLPDCKSLEQHCFGYVKAICVQHAIDLLLPSQSIRLEKRPRLLPRHPAHSSSTPCTHRLVTRMSVGSLSRHAFPVKHALHCVLSSWAYKRFVIAFTV
jgi:hypothetical protein